MSVKKENMFSFNSQNDFQEINLAEVHKDSELQPRV